MTQNGNKQFLVVALIAGGASIAGAFIGAWSGREVATTRMDAMEKVAASNTLAIAELTKHVQALASEQGRISALAAATKAVQDERTQRFQELEARKK